MLSVFPWKVALFGFYFYFGFSFAVFLLPAMILSEQKYVCLSKYPRQSIYTKRRLFGLSFWGFGLWSVGSDDVGAVGKGGIDGKEHTLKQSCPSHNGQEKKRESKVPLLFSRAFHSGWKVPESPTPSSFYHLTTAPSWVLINLQCELLWAFSDQ